MGAMNRSVGGPRRTGCQGRTDHALPASYEAMETSRKITSAKTSPDLRIMKVNWRPPDLLTRVRRGRLVTSSRICGNDNPALQVDTTGQRRNLRAAVATIGSEQQPMAWTDEAEKLCPFGGGVSRNRSGHGATLRWTRPAGGAARPSSQGCTTRASQPGRICRNVIDVDETPIKITIDDTVITARLADNATAHDLAAQLPLTLTFKDFNHVE
jgi:hypothetical protein